MVLYHYIITQIYINITFKNEPIYYIKYVLFINKKFKYGIHICFSKIKRESTLPKQDYCYTILK